MTTPNPAATNAALAADVASKLKPGNYDAVKALSLLSIAQSLEKIASALEGRSLERG